MSLGGLENLKPKKPLEDLTKLVVETTNSLIDNTTSKQKGEDMQYEQVIVFPIARPFIMERLVDVTGVSGTGRVMEGVIVHTGQVISTWLTETPSVTVHVNMMSAKYIYGHGVNNIFKYERRDMGEYPKTHIIFHEKDVTGLSYEGGIVAFVVEFSNKKAAMIWNVSPFQIETFDNLSDLKKVHIDGRDYVKFEDFNG